MGFVNRRRPEAPPPHLSWRGPESLAAKIHTAVPGQRTGAAAAMVGGASLKCPCKTAAEVSLIGTGRLVLIAARGVRVRRQEFEEPKVALNAIRQLWMFV